MEYWKMVNGTLRQIHDFDDALESIRIEYQSKVDTISRLSNVIVERNIYSKKYVEVLHG